MQSLWWFGVVHSLNIDILYAIIFCQGPVCYPGTVVTGWGTERNNNFIFHSGHTTPASLWDLNKLNTIKFVNVNILYVFRQFRLLSFLCNVDPSSWWWQPIVTMVLVKVIIIHHSPTKECILVHWSNIMPTNDPSSFYNWCFNSAILNTVLNIKTSFDWIILLCVSYLLFPCYQPKENLVLLFPTMSISILNWRIFSNITFPWELFMDRELTLKVK